MGAFLRMQCLIVDVKIRFLQNVVPALGIDHRPHVSHLYTLTVHIMAEFGHIVAHKAP